MTTVHSEPVVNRRPERMKKRSRCDRDKKDYHPDSLIEGVDSSDEEHSEVEAAEASCDNERVTFDKRIDERQSSKTGVDTTMFPLGNWCNRLRYACNQLQNGQNTGAWSMEKSGVVTEEVEKYVHFRANNDDLDSLDDGTIAIMKELETKKKIRHLGVFAKCNAPDTPERGRRALQKVRMRIEDVKLRNKSGKVAILTTNVLLVTVAQWNTLQAISSLEVYQFIL